MKIVRNLKHILPAAPIGLVALTAIAFGHSDGASQSGQLQTSAHPIGIQAPAPPVDVTVNGQKVPVQPNATVQVQAEGGVTSVSNTGSDQFSSTTVTNSAAGSVNLTVDSESNHGTSSSHTSIHSGGTSHVSSHSTIKVTTNGPGDIHVTQ